MLRNVTFAALLFCALAASGQPSDPWSVTVGATAISAPKYPGAEERRFLAVPYWDVEYRERFFSKGLDFAGAWLTKRPDWKAGAALAWEFDDREEKDAPAFRGLGDVDPTLRARLFASYTRSLVTISADSAHDVLGRGHGWIGSTGISVAVPFFAPWFFAAGPEVGWMDGEYAATFFGIDSTQSLRSGRTQFAAGGGVRDVSLSVVARRPLRGAWSATAVASLRRLEGDAGASPLTPNDRESVFILTFARRLR